MRAISRIDIILIATATLVRLSRESYILYIYVAQRFIVSMRISWFFLGVICHHA